MSDLISRQAVYDILQLKTIQTVYGKVTWIKSDYCPACGAYMRESE